MIRGTTPTLTLNINDSSVDLTQAANVYVTLRQKGSCVKDKMKTVTKTGDDLRISANKIECFLSQEDTLYFTNGYADVQVNWTYRTDSDTIQRVATKIKSICMDDQLLCEVAQ